MKKQKCLRCGKLFESVTRTTKHCSAHCAEESRKIRNKRAQDKLRAKKRNGRPIRPRKVKEPESVITTIRKGGLMIMHFGGTT